MAQLLGKGFDEMEMRLYDEAIEQLRIYNSKPADPHVSILQFMNNFRCEKNVETPNAWDCRNCNYYYRADSGCVRCLKQEIQDWVIFREENVR